jgi:hypothetical protein
MKAVIDLAIATLWPAIHGCLLLGAVLGLVVGGMLLLDSPRALRWNSALSTWISSRQALRPLDEPHDIKRVIYRWHRLLGLVIFAGALYTLDVLVFRYQGVPLARAFRDLANPGLLALLFDGIRYALIAGNAAALAAGLVLCLRPSLLKGLEAWADLAYSSRKPTKPLDVMHYAPDEFVRSRPRVIGALLAIGSLYILVVLGSALL